MNWGILSLIIIIIELFNKYIYLLDLYYYCMVQQYRWKPVHKKEIMSEKFVKNVWDQSLVSTVKQLHLAERLKIDEAWFTEQ